MNTPNSMPARANVRPNPEYAGECMDPECCTHYYAPRIVGKRRTKSRSPRQIPNTALADQLREKGFVK